MKKIINSTHLEGYLFGHTLEKRVTGEASKEPGTEYIRGNVEIMTDDAGLNVVPVTFSYVTAKTKAGKDNATYKTLLGIIESTGNTYPEVGTGATKIRIDTATGLNDFYNQEGEHVSYKQNDGGFVHTTNMFSGNRNAFEIDLLLTNVIEKEEDDEKGTPAMVILKGATFNFRGSILPIDLVVKSEGGMKYFADLGATPGEPVFIKVWGQVVSTTQETETVEESAFGEAAVKTTIRRLREWLVTGASTEPYAYGDEAVLTADEVAKAIGERETYLAETKKRHEEYLASKGTTTTTASAGGAAPAAAPGGFNF